MDFLLNPSSFNSNLWVMSHRRASTKWISILTKYGKELTASDDVDVLCTFPMLYAISHDHLRG